MDESTGTRFLRLLEVLVRHGVDFIIVGGVAASLEGAPVLTFDLDVVYETSPENTERLLQVLREIHARYRDPGGRQITPDATRLGRNRLNLFTTDLGPFDVLPAVSGDLRFQDLLSRTNIHEVGGFEVRVLDLEAVIQAKEYANRDKDRAVLPVLRRTLEMKGPKPDGST
jgi:predicted nucleotidyltransferase